MNKFKYVKGDLIVAYKKGEIDVIMHQENFMGYDIFAGVAKAIHKQVKGLTEAHVEYCQEDNYGTYLLFEDGDKYVINLYTQYNLGSPSLYSYYSKGEFKLDTLNNRFEALYNCIKLLNKDKRLKGKKIGCPLISSGLASFKPNKIGKTDLQYFKEYIEPILEECNLDITIYYL